VVSTTPSTAAASTRHRNPTTKPPPCFRIVPVLVEADDQVGQASASIQRFFRATYSAVQKPTISRSHRRAGGGGGPTIVEPHTSDKTTARQGGARQVVSRKGPPT